ncbi:MAG: UDP-N-acetylmuramoyl-tripeptide--D-alanyl-D-alanine ligase [Clostridia bacterium]|nr:UDP-N-acetylmuramoyl-tripeptide--D-alanyl-D-alanine ligase [Clostridia bacterium]
MRPTGVKFLAAACEDAIILGNPRRIVKDVKIDSRECKAGDMFVCIKGEKTDGHDYIIAAYNKGCRCFLVTKEQNIYDATFIVVKDTVKAFCDMAAAYLNEFKLRKVAVTGSVGKTTTKMLTAAVLSSKFRTIATKKNLNTDLGIALTSFDADGSTQAVVFEMGMDKPGEIAGYVKRVHPEVAIITNVGISHLERLGTRDAIADAKLEIVSEFDASNVLIVNSSSDYLKTKEEIRTRAKNKEHFKIVGVGSDMMLENVRAQGTSGIEFNLNGVHFELPLIGEHNAVDAALAASCGIEYGIPLKKAADALRNVSATEKRLKLEDLSGIILIDDSYNASPDSVVAGIAAIGSITAQRKILVLGDMLELGSESVRGHNRVGEAAARLGVNMVVAYGDNKEEYLDGMRSVEGNRCAYMGLNTLDEVKEYVLKIIRKGDAVLVKGSNSTKISEVAELIRKTYHAK